MKIFSSAILATAVFADPPSRVRRDYPSNPAPNCSESNKYQNFWYSKDSGNFNKCVFSAFMEQVGREQMDRALKLITDNPRDFVHDQNIGFNGIIEDWKKLTGIGTVEAGHDFTQGHLKCGFVAVEKKFHHDWEKDQYREGFFDGCDKMCPSFENIGSYGQGNAKENAEFVAKSILENIISIVAEQFTKQFTDSAAVDGPNGTKLYRISMCRYDPEMKFIDTWDINKRDYVRTKHSGWVNGYDNECSMADRCGQIVRNLYAKVAGFEEVLGKDSIPSLADYEQGFRNDYERMTNKKYKYYDPRQLLGRQRVIH